MAHDAFWAAARAARGDAAGTRALIEVLLLHRRMPASAVTAGITAALDAGAANPQLVAIEARNAAAATDAPSLLGPLPASEPSLRDSAAWSPI